VYHISKCAKSRHKFVKEGKKIIHFDSTESNKDDSENMDITVNRTITVTGLLPVPVPQSSTTYWIYYFSLEYLLCRCG